MASKDNKKRGEVEEPSRWSNEITGIIWITAGLLLFLSLVKYSPADLPKWGILEAFADKSGAAGENLIGPVGGLLGFLQILLFGAAGCLIPVGLIWFGIVKLAFDGRIWPRAVVGFSVLLLSGAAWLHAADYFFVDWARNCHLNSPGGVIGAGLGGFILTGVIGRAGTLLVTSAAYVVAVILLTGHQPVRFTKACFRLVRMKFDAWRESRSETGKAAAREAELLAERERQREQRRKEREAAKISSSNAVADEDPQALLPLRDTPPPRSSTPRNAASTSPWNRAVNRSNAKNRATSSSPSRASKTTNSPASTFWMPWRTRRHRRPTATSYSRTSG